MKIELPKLTGKLFHCGAPMGRTSEHIDGKCHLQKIPLDSGGYDFGGAYWGLGEPLYCAQDSEGSRLFVRANSREQAKEKILSLSLAHDVTFYR